MANTTTVDGRFITITGLDTDWVHSVDLPNPINKGQLYVQSIRFHPSGADVFVVHDESIDGAEVFSVKCLGDTDDRIQYYHGRGMRPVIDISDCTFATAANAKVTIELM